MEIIQYSCNDCGCRFEYRILERKEPAQKKAKKKSEAQPRRVMCPECESYNITTA